jgi:uncharacterized membrane protein HdeD (DUF308 family)
MTDQTIDASAVDPAPPPAAEAQPAQGAAPPAPSPAESSAADRGARPSAFWLIVLGAALVLGGAAAIASPFVASLAVAAWIGAIFAVAGGVQLVQAFGAEGWRGGLWHLLNGGLYLLGGLLIVFRPLEGMVALSWLIVATMALCGAARVIGGLAMRPLAGWLWVLLGGLVTIGAAAAIGSLMPGAGAVLLGVAVGVSLIVEGAAAIATGVAVRRA